MDKLLLKLRDSYPVIKAKSFDILNDGYRSKESIQTKCEEIDDFLYGRKDLYGYRIKDVLRLIRFIEKL